MRSRILQRKAEDLAGTSNGFRRVEIVAIVVFAASSAVLAHRLAPFAARFPGWAGLAFLGGWISADFVSGFVHWAGDTWGTPEWPLIGRSLIRTFREHHVDPEAITRHDFIETNGTNCLISLPVLGAALLLPAGPALGWAPLAAAWMLSLTLWVLLTNQIHKWAHSRRNPPVVRWLQRSRIILSREHHAIHHTPPFVRYYCITTGWLNPLLYRTGYFRAAERLVTALTGAIPREDDLGRDAALEILAGAASGKPAVGERSEDIRWLRSS